MILEKLSGKYRKHSAWTFYVIFCMYLIIPLKGISTTLTHNTLPNYYGNTESNLNSKLPTENIVYNKSVDSFSNNYLSKKSDFPFTASISEQKEFIGGPIAPEASSFKAVGSDNLVNLFTGDFSYSIPLMDVGGYPINLFYNGGISMEQEASWVGLGWNINPGTVNRNMRGVPDDFNGEDELVQYQNMKPNRTYGGEAGTDVEIFGFKKPNAQFSSGISYNNYLGPAIEVGLSVTQNFSKEGNLRFTKSPTSKDTGQLGMSVSIKGKLSSRSGLTLSPSLNALMDVEANKTAMGVGLNTSYNSRMGIKDINLSAEMRGYKEGSDKKGYDLSRSGNSLVSSSISFARSSYMPIMRMPTANYYFAAKLDLGAGAYGVRASGTVNGYYSETKVPKEWRVQKKPLVGYIFSEKAMNNKNAVMDLNRVNDAEVTPNTPVISAPQYTYDIFSIQGEGTGGTIRAYRGDLGYMRDNKTVSKEINASIGADPAGGHWGGSFDVITAPTTAGGWDDENNTLKITMPFDNKQSNNSAFENVYFRNPGETTVTNEETINRIGQDKIVRFDLGGTKVTPRLNSLLELFDKKTNTTLGKLSIANANQLSNRNKRSQIVTMLSASEASLIGLDKKIKSYLGTVDNTDHYLQYVDINRVDSYRKGHHISEIDVLEPNGMRYVYGLPVYNILQKDFTFSVGDVPSQNGELVKYEVGQEGQVNSKHMDNNSKIDGYFLAQETPAFASSFLLTGLLSPDYVDVTNDGITEDDLGNAVKFNYEKSEDHLWRTPRNNSSAGSGKDWAIFNEGNKSEKKDNKANISFGQREVWYLNSLESKSMIAIFKTDSRNDAKGVLDMQDGRINALENANKKLSRIDLYTKSEIKEKGITNAKPIKSVIFNYDYGLCFGTPDNASGGGKLTLKSIFFTYNGQNRNEKDRYVFDYGSTADNPSYALNASDRWGSYKDPSDNTILPAGLTNADYTYTSNDKIKNDQFAGAWSLKKILLPSGGQMEIEYEADDYAYVQNRRACNMITIAGLGESPTYSNAPYLYNFGPLSQDNNYVFIKLLNPLTALTASGKKNEIHERYLHGQKQIAFKLSLKMPNGKEEPITIYSEFEEWDICSNNNQYFYIKLKEVDGKSPLANAAIGLLTNNFPGQAFPGYETEMNNFNDFLGLFVSLLVNAKSVFQNVENQMRSAGKARQIILDHSFARLTNPNKVRFGGGSRVKKIVVKDNWKKMTERNSNPSGTFTSMYGQEYDYTTIEKIEGKDVSISSGVASYEPALGGEENPFREIVQFKNKLPLASAIYGAIELPVMDAFYPAAYVGYSKITVRSINRKGKYNDSTLRSSIGKQVTQFYTARDFPTYSTYTTLNSVDYKKNPKISFLYKEVITRRTISQGFLIETNDMHGKIKSQESFSESDEKTPLSGSYHTYKNTGKNGLNDKVDFVYNKQGGIVSKGNMGIDIELMTDVREFRIESSGLNGQINSDLFVFPFVTFVWLTYLPLGTYTENKYRAVTCTKLITYHAIEDSVIVIDKGSSVSTKTIAYDSESGSSIVSSTANEFNDPIYNINYPAHWAYSGVEPAYKNIDRVFKNIDFTKGKITNDNFNASAVFESGDEIFVLSAGSSSSSCVPPSADVNKLWVFDLQKNNSSLSVVNRDLIFMDSSGMPFTRNGVNMRIVRSGKRNNLNLMVATVTAMKNPIQLISGALKLVVDNNSKVVSASASELKEKWQTDYEVFLRRVYYPDVCTGIETDSISCSGILEKNINPYLKGLLGNFKAQRSFVFYSNRIESDPTAITAIRKNGYIANYNNYWNFDINNNLVPIAHPSWVWNSELTKVNSRGQELETKDALERYTSAQYGFNKNQTVALTQNSRYGESFYEGFEDYGYNERINNFSIDQVICNKKFIDFYGILNSNIAYDDVGKSAHSGKKYLTVAAGTTANKNLPISMGYEDDFHFDIQDGNIITFIPGSNGFIDSLNVNPSLQSTSFNYPLSTLGNLNMQLRTNNYVGGIFGPRLQYNGTSSSSFSSLYATTQFVKIITPGTYHFAFNTIQDVVELGNPPPQPLFNRTSLTFQISQANGTPVYTLPSPSYSDNNPSSSVDIYLPCGIYKVYCTVGMDLQMPGNKTTMHKFFSKANYTSNVTGIMGSYVSCTFLKPIPAKDSMLNVTEFQLTKEKKMMFSAWIKEDCTIPCSKTDYSLSNINIETDGGGSGTITSMNRVGSIIEGWQKIEGVFIIPSDATTASIVMINSNTSAPMSVDDIRIQPFNSNMKSYVYDNRTLKLSAELDENNYTTYYEYDEEGQLVRVKKETIGGIKTIQETRSSKQKSLITIQ